MSSPASIVALDTVIDAGLERLSAAKTTAEQKAAIEAVHDAVMIETRRLDDPPIAALNRLGEALAPVASKAVDSLPMRVRVAVRLLRAGAAEPAWVVMSDSAADRVKRGVVRDSTVPLTVRIEAGTAYAWLPGFRDPRYEAPDDCFEMTDRIEQRSHLDTASIAAGQIQLSGWTSLAYLDARDDEKVSVALHAAGRSDVVVAARRRRRPDLVKGTGEALTRRAWAGWSAQVDLASLTEQGSASWDFTVTIERDGISRTAALAFDEKGSISGHDESSPRRFGPHVLLASAPTTGKLRLEVSPPWDVARRQLGRVRRRLGRVRRRAAWGGRKVAGRLRAQRK